MKDACFVPPRQRRTPLGQHARELGTGSGRLGNAPATLHSLSHEPADDDDEEEKDPGNRSRFLHDVQTGFREDNI